MTDADRLAFVACLNTLSKALRPGLPPLDLVDVEIYFRRLSDLPLSAIETSAFELQRTHVTTSGQSFFPSTAQWWAAAERAQLEQLRTAIPAAREEPWHYICDDCSDTGWRIYDCTPAQRCGRQFCARSETYTHSYGSACACRATNPEYRRKHPTITEG